MATEKTSRATLREHLLKTQPMRGKTVTIENLTCEVRRLSIKERNDIISKARDKSEKGDVTYLQVSTVIAACFVPGTGEKVFDSTDYEALANSQESGIVDVLYAAYNDVSQHVDSAGLDVIKKD